MQPTGAGSGSRQLQLTSIYGQHVCPLLWLWNGREDDCYSQMVATWGGGVHQHPSFINWKGASLMGNETLTWEIKLQNWSCNGWVFFPVWEESSIAVFTVGITRKWLDLLSILQSITEAPVGLWVEQYKTSEVIGWQTRLFLTCRVEGGRWKVKGGRCRDTWILKAQVKSAKCLPRQNKPCSEWEHLCHIQLRWWCALKINTGYRLPSVAQHELCYHFLASPYFHKQQLTSDRLPSSVTGGRCIV